MDQGSPCGEGFAPRRVDCVPCVALSWSDEGRRWSLGALRRSCGQALASEITANSCTAHIASGRYKPLTMNTDLSVLRVVMASAKLELDLLHNPMASGRTVRHQSTPAYTFEEPNSLTVDELRGFLRRMRDAFAGHCAMTFIGFALGKRPSTLRPLRRKGSTPDIHRDTGVLLFRRSNTLGQRGDGRRQDRWRGARASTRAAPRDPALARRDAAVNGLLSSVDLLSPALYGGFRSRNVLDKPLRAAARAVGLEKRVTPRGMRRTFQDLCCAGRGPRDPLHQRACHRSHATALQHARAFDEQRRGIACVIQLLEPHTLLFERANPPPLVGREVGGDSPKWGGSRERPVSPAS
jgi:hypothetical protein